MLKKSKSKQCPYLVKSFGPEYECQIDIDNFGEPGLVCLKDESVELCMGEYEGCETYQENKPAYWGDIVV